MTGMTTTVTPTSMTPAVAASVTTAMTATRISDDS